MFRPTSLAAGSSESSEQRQQRRDVIDKRAEIFRRFVYFIEQADRSRFGEDQFHRHSHGNDQGAIGRGVKDAEDQTQD